MQRIETLELNAHRRQLRSDVSALVEKYRSIFGWDVPDLDQSFADGLILAAIRQAVDDIETDLATPLP